MTSKKFTLVSEDYKKMAINALTYSLPIFALSFLTQIQMGVSIEVALKSSLSVILGIAIDALKKYTSVNKY